MSADLVNLNAGTYTATVVDANGCTASVTQTLVDPPAIVLSLQMNNPSCAATANGALDLTATGGTGGLQFSWSNSASSADLTLLPRAPIR